MTIPEQLAQALADLTASTDALATERANVLTLTSQLEAEKATSASAAKALGELNTKFAASEAAASEFSAQIAILKTEAKTATERATDMASRVGVLPVAAEGTAKAVSSDMTLDEARAAMAKATDSREKGRLAILSRKLRGLT